MATPTAQRNLNPRNDPLAAWLHIDFLLVLATLALSAIGVAMIYSTTRGIDPAAYDTTFMQRQLIFVMLGAALMAAMAVVPYDRLQSWAPLFYIAGLLSLVGVLVLGVEGGLGGQSWFAIGGYQLQPSEFLKVVYVVVLSSMVARHDGQMNWQQLVLALITGAIPMVLILVQPDVGTMLVFVAITMGVLLVGGARFSHIVLLTLLGILAAMFLWNVGALSDYQQDRLTSFFDPDSSQSEAAYQQTQAQIAIGSGGVSGQGFGQGGQTRGEFVPAQHTDFIFTVVGEELGFVGSATVLGLFALLIWRAWRTAKKAADLFGALLCVGVMTMMVFQMFQAVGMTLGIMPITGIPVPFMSYGGSSALTSFAAVGLVLNVHMRRYQVR